MRIGFIILLLFPILVRADPRHDDIIRLINSSDIRGVEATGSMKPVLDERYLLILQSIPFKDLKKDDIIVFTNPDNLLVVHRIWAISKPEGRVMLTKGDANQLIDPWYVTERDYVGMVVGIIRADLMEKALTQDKVSAQ